MDENSNMERFELEINALKLHLNINVSMDPIIRLYAKVIMLIKKEIRIYVLLYHFSLKLL